MQNTTPTTEQFAAYQAMCDYFNEALFGGKLPKVILNFSRKGRTLGFFAPHRWERGPNQVVHEISLNPEHLKERTAKDVAATLVHELTHLEQQEFGTPTRNGYHNAAWGKLMEAVGLIPSDTAAPGGKRTGQRMSHYIEEGGRFERAFEAMPEECLLPWVGCPLVPEEKKQKASRSKYRCEDCGAQAWAKPGVHLMCGGCETDLGEVPAGEG